MKKAFIFFGVIIFSIAVLAQPPDTLWTWTYGGISSDYSESIQITSDGGFIIAGSTYSTGQGYNDVLLLKTDSLGNLIWFQALGSGNHDQGESVCLTQDGGYIVTGGTFVGNNPEVYLVKTDENGNEVWSRTFGGPLPDCGRCIQNTNDGGYIIAGETNALSGMSDVYLIKTDENGNEQWNRTFGGEGYQSACSIQQTDDSGFIVAGITDSAGFDYDVYLIKTDSFGNQIWSQTYGGLDSDYSRCVKQTDDRGYIIAGYTYSFGAGDKDVYIIKVDSIGITEWSQTFGGAEPDRAFSIDRTFDGGYLIAGDTYSFTNGGSDLYLIKIDLTGIMEWSQTIGGDNVDTGHSILQLSDGGFVITGHTRSYGAGNYDVWLLRFDAEINLSLTVTLTPLNPPVQIPAVGGTFDFNISGTNNDSISHTFDIWTMATLPNGSEYGPIILVEDFTLGAGQTVNRDRTQSVPASAPSGNYTYDAYIGVYPDIIWEEDHFDFEKLAAGDGSKIVNDWECWGEGFGTGNDNPQLAVDNYTVMTAHPNPFNASTIISFELRDASFVSLAVYDITGREVAALVNGFESAGAHSVTWDAEGFSSGIYFVRLEVLPGAGTRQHEMVGKMLLVK